MGFPCIGAVLRVGSFSKVGLRIVGGVVVFVVNDSVVTDLDNLAMHWDQAPLIGSGIAGESFCVVVAAISDREPFIILEALVVVGIDFGVPRASQGNAPIGRAVTRSTEP